MGEDYVERNQASGGKRFANLIIDIIAMVILSFFIGIILGSMAATETMLMLASYLTYFIYYWLMEAVLGKTVGKYVTRTRVVKPDGSQPSAINILGRTFSRIIPFDAFSYLGSTSSGWHDSIPKIYVIEEE